MCDDWAPYNPASRSGDCGCGNRVPASGRAALGLGRVNTSAWDGRPPQDTQEGWISRAGSWAWGQLSGLFSRNTECRDPIASYPPCPGQTPDAVMLAAWNAAPLSVRAELWARGVVNNPQWRCYRPASLLTSAVTVGALRYAAWGGGDCIMSNDRGRLRPAWDSFISQYGGGEPSGPGGPLLSGEGNGLVLAAMGVAAFVLLSPDG